MLSYACIADVRNDAHHSGTVNVSVNATDQVGFECASKHAKGYFLSELPKFFSNELAKAGLLRGKDNGRYLFTLVIDRNSKIQDYQVGGDTSEQSSVVQTILAVGQLPNLSKDNTCVADKVFAYEIIIS